MNGLELCGDVEASDEFCDCVMFMWRVRCRDAIAPARISRTGAVFAWVRKVDSATKWKGSLPFSREAVHSRKFLACRRSDFLEEQDDIAF
jgi:hypothetical protein